MYITKRGHVHGQRSVLAIPPIGAPESLSRATLKGGALRHRLRRARAHDRGSTGRKYGATRSVLLVLADCRSAGVDKASGQPGLYAGL